MIRFQKIFLVFISLLASHFAFAQGIPKQITSSSMSSFSSQGGNQQKTKKDSLQHRDDLKDSITISYKYFDSSRSHSLDSSINDFTKKLPLPYYYNHIGNYGSAAYSLLFQPNVKVGWDAGFHQFDVYNLSVENTKFYQTTKPYSELAYMIGNKSEQFVDFLHTQNRKTNFNFSFEYKFSNSPGLYRLQNANHSNMRITAHYKSHNKRYELYFIMINTTNNASENGGLKNVTQLYNLTFSDPYQAMSRLGYAGTQSRNPFNVTINTGNAYFNNTLLIRHQYDFGQRDSLVLDTVTVPLFYPRFRIQHTLNYSNSIYNYRDIYAIDSLYTTYFNYPYAVPATGDTVSFKEQWKVLTNELSMITFPEKNNQSQFLKIGAALQNLKAEYSDTVSKTYYNLYGLAEYRNRTRNQKWDVEAAGKLYLNGTNAGDYAVLISLKRELSKKAGNLQIGFQNVNRTPSAIFSPETIFPLKNRQSFNKENTTNLFALYENPVQHFKLSGNYYLIGNYVYMDSFFTARQEATLFNFLRISLEKKFRLAKNLNWYTENHLQQTTGNAPVHVPLFFSRNRIAFEGNFYTNLFLSTGLEIKYYTNYQVDNYSPFTGQFFYQSVYTTANRPTVDFFFHFRIKGFKCFSRIENLQTLNTADGFKFNHYNIAPQNYPALGLWLRLGVWWSFVN